MKTRITLLLAALVCPSQLRAQAPGRLDTTFQAQLPTNFVPQVFGPLAVQPDGKIIVGGEFFLRDGFFGPHPPLPGPQFLARLNPDGSLDTSFNPIGIQGSLGEPDTYVFSSITVQSDGKIVLCGNRFEVPELGQRGLARLNPDGSVDTSFASAAGGGSKLVILPDGGYLIAGPGLLRLKPNGELDSAFVPQLRGADSYVYDFAVQPDGRIVVAIIETLIDGQKRSVIRLLPDGSYDPSFEPVLIGGGVTARTMPDGKILLGGISAVNGRASPEWVRLHPDGRFDLEFVPFTSDLDFGNLAIQRDGKIILFQYGKAVGSPGQLVRLHTDGRRDETYVGGLRDAQGVYAVALQPDGKLVSSVNVSGVVSIIRLHGDGVPYIVPPSVRANSSGIVEFQITAATTRTMVIESSADLKSGPWTVLATFPPAVGRGTIQFSDSGSAKTPQRFYRAVSP